MDKTHIMRAGWPFLDFQICLSLQNNFESTEKYSNFTAKAVVFIVYC